MTSTRQTQTKYPEYPTLGALLNIARDLRGMTKTAAYEDIGTTAMTYRMWIQGGQNPDVFDKEHNWVTRIADHADVPEYVVLAAMGILPHSEARIIWNAVGDIPGYRRSRRNNTHLSLVTDTDS